MGLYREKYGFLMQRGKCMEIEYVRDWDVSFRVYTEILLVEINGQF